MLKEVTEGSEPGNTSAPIARKGRRIALIVSIALMVLLTGTGAYLWLGGYSHWQDKKSLARACQGILPRDELESLMSNDLRGTDERMFEVGSGWLDGCTVEAREGRDGTTQFGIGWSDQVSMPLSALGRIEFAGENGAATPIGHGWTGSMTRSGSAGNASVLLECKGLNKNLLVTARSYRGKFSENSSISQGFGSLAKVATRTAQKAAAKWDCDAPLGRSVDSVTPPAKMARDLPSLAQASGSCRSMTSLTAALSQRKVRKSLDTPEGNSLVEDCYLLDADGNAVYRLSAYYGPYARDLLSTRAWPNPGPAGIEQKSGYAWASSQCRNFFGTARFTSGIVENSDKAAAPADPGLQRELLAAFVKDSAERHGCSGTELP
ncbi:hypothetical protein [Streptomyces albireticuli]|uniref:Uncharacterized protein n=1 Tax=Streptomyces albireticuli TaxID=1940 RepID=A0A2A2D819_9ACTN|nr:hypothetical protein [Streptomyces albireticuli]MCD9145942.1 hypothetical protein [Streptomyces albireticuli]MCD9166116.1 hypothetical protein [Streptomyces albireticuli]MCD9196441.1 hypothetical protein [Streptomyces albireticuli]PAU47597.1 hypothetical protein CK936_17800 [Streptomyces albireticuli]